jgi:type IV pilus assembly protein PilO
MPKNFSFGGGMKLGGAGVRDPRVVMRVILGVLLAANLAAAAVAFKPFGGSAYDLRREQQRLASQLDQLRTRIKNTKQLVDKVQTAHSEGDQFLAKYFMDVQTFSTLILEELSQTATDSGIKMGGAQFDHQPIEGSDSLVKYTITVGFDGTYANLTKFIHQVDKSPRFLIIESMQAAAPQAQGGQSLNVTLKILAFVKDTSGAAI